MIFSQALLSATQRKPFQSNSQSYARVLVPVHEAVANDAAAVVRRRRKQRVPRVEAHVSNGAAVLPSKNTMYSF